MNFDRFKAYCLAKKGVTEEFPFDEKTAVFKVMGKMFAAADITLFESVNVKCDPDKALELRAAYSGVLPGYHMSKKHWNTILMDGSVPDDAFLSWVDDSYDLVVSGLSRAMKEALKGL